jgi:hypothetical protein
MRRWSGAVYIFQQETNKQVGPMRRICNDKFCFLENLLQAAAHAISIDAWPCEKPNDL